MELNLCHPVLVFPASMVGVEEGGELPPAREPVNVAELGAYMQDLLHHMHTRSLSTMPTNRMDPGSRGCPSRSSPGWTT